MTQYMAHLNSAADTRQTYMHISEMTDNCSYSLLHSCKSLFLAVSQIRAPNRWTADAKGKQ